MYDGDTVELLLLALDEGTGMTRAARGGRGLPGHGEAVGGGHAVAQLRRRAARLG